jgi:hypothetical protein
MPIQLQPVATDHTEFEQCSQTISVVEPPDLEFEIQSVTYEHERGIRFSDMNISHTAKSFTFNTKYEFCVPREVDFTTTLDGVNLLEHSVANITFLPKEYEAIFCVHLPPESTWVRYTAHGREREIREVTDAMTGSTSKEYGEWYPQSYTMTDTVETSFHYNCLAVTNSVKGGSRYINSPIKPSVG